ncbi:hypothetical protein QQM39_36630 [Streptomyces sp. DT2A-34]|uniref:hypothetical protein n=1 Tax=Streptomyces sp. DT2A-34 TaxID=3051182 RepID=UPI00265C58D1|nr:hypothetical protein [Streptomyces sp. DT2A-34]MDO0916159.1 hypothetical protein [Streptomyces sp. DT2A-34]
MSESGRRADIDRVIEPLNANMPKAGGFGFEAIRRLGNPVPLLVRNNGDEQPQLWLEPAGQDYWLDPGPTSWFATVTDH